MSLEDVSFEDEQADGAAEFIGSSKVPNTELDYGYPLLSGDPASPFRDHLTPPLSSEPSAS